jgi:hypothetical protein
MLYLYFIQSPYEFVREVEDLPGSQMSLHQIVAAGHMTQPQAGQHNSLAQ